MANTTGSAGSTVSNGWQTNSTFNPYNQTFVILKPDGQTPFVGNTNDILTLNTVCVSQSAIYGAQAGLSGLLLIVLLLMTKPDKRRSAVFLLNVLCLVLIFIRNIMSCIELTTLFYNFYNWELHWYPDSASLSHAMAVSASTDILNVIIDAAIYSSLIVQVHIVCCTLHTLTKEALMVVSGLVAMATLGVRTALAVFNIKYSILGINTLTEDQFNTINRIGIVNQILTVAAIAFYSAIFVTKLGLAIRLRSKLNIKNFGAMQIIFIMGCQTMVVPLIFTAISFYTVRGSQINSMVPTIVAIFLPLSGMWASAQTSNEIAVRRAGAVDSRFHRAVPVGITDFSSTKGTKHTGRTESDLLRDDERHIVRSSTPDSPNGRSVAADLEMQHFKNGVVVDRTYSVRSD